MITLKHLKRFDPVHPRLSLSHQGFTLVEILAAVAILSVMGAIAVPASINLYFRLEMDAAQGEVFQAVQLAKAQSLRTSQGWGAQVSQAAGQSIEIRVAPLADDTLNSGLIPPDECTPTVGCLRSRVSASSVSLTPGVDPCTGNTIRFLPQGIAGAAATDICRVTLTSTNSTVTNRCIALSSFIGGARSFECP